MTRREFAERMNRIDPDRPSAVDELAALFEEDYISSGKDLKDPSTTEKLILQANRDLEYFMGRYDLLQQKLNNELRKAGASEAQINWGLFGNVELPTFMYLRCNHMAKKLIRYCYQILYCLGELKMLSKYTDVDLEELRRIQLDYGRKYG